MVDLYSIASSAAKLLNFSRISTNGYVPSSFIALKSGCAVISQLITSLRDSSTPTLPLLLLPNTSVYSKILFCISFKIVGPSCLLSTALYVCRYRAVFALSGKFKKSLLILAYPPSVIRLVSIPLKSSIAPLVTSPLSSKKPWRCVIDIAPVLSNIGNTPRKLDDITSDTVFSSSTPFSSVVINLSSILCDFRCFTTPLGFILCTPPLSTSCCVY